MANHDGLEAYIDASAGVGLLYEKLGWAFTKQIKLPRFGCYCNFASAEVRLVTRDDCQIRQRNIVHFCPALYPRVDR
jgi:hypothetical protein